MVLLLLACGGPTPPTLMQRDPAPTGRPDDAAPFGFTRTGEIGDITVTTSLPWLDRSSSLAVSALFGSDLGAAALPSVCGLEGRLCVAPSPLEEDVPSDIAVAPERISWLGDRLRIGELVLPFVVEPSAPLGGYRLVVEEPPSLPTRLDLFVDDGEWEEGALPSGVGRPPGLTGLWPDPALPVVVGDRVTQAFEWTPASETDVWLVTRGLGRDGARRLVDDGEAFVDLRDLRWTGPLTVELWRVSSTSRPWNGNEVVSHGATVQSWCVIDACAGPPVDAWPFRFRFAFSWSATNLGEAEWTLFEDGTWRAGQTSQGTWTFDCCTRTLSMRFTSGTVYSGVVGADGCIDGIMRSWNGGTGTWAGCL